MPLTRERLALVSRETLRLSLLAMLLVVPLVFCTLAHDVFEINKITAFRVFTLIALLAWTVRALALGGIRIRPSVLWPPVLMVALSSLLSTLWTNNFLTSVFGVYEDFEGILTMLNYVLLWFLVHQTVRSRREVHLYLGAVVLAGSLASLYGVAQNFGIDIVMWNPATYSASRLFGSLGNPNFLAAYVLMTLPVAFIFFLSARRPAVKGGLATAVVIMAVVIFFTKSRGAVYALVLESALFAGYVLFDRMRGGSLWRDNRRWFAVLAVLAVLTLFSPTVRSTVKATTTRTLATLNLKTIRITPRLYIWRSALQMMRDHPLLGVGLDTFQITFPKYRLAEYWRLEWNGTPEKAHNFFLQIGATTGFLGLAAWLWLLAAWLAVLIRQLRRLPPEQRHLAAAIGIAQAGFLAQNQFNFTVVAYGSLFWFFLALGPAVSRDEPAETVDRPGDPVGFGSLAPWRRVALPAAVLILFAGAVGSLRLWAADVYFKRGIILMARGYPEQALPQLQRAVELHPAREIYWVKYGIGHEEAAKRAQDKQPFLEKAAEIHRHTIGMNPLNGYDYNNLGRVYKFWGDYLNPQKLEDAERACRKATELDPYNVYFALDLASVHLAQKRFAEAGAIAGALAETFPDFAMPYAYLGYVALMSGDVDTAYLRLKEATEKNWRGDVNTRSSTWSNLGIILARRADNEAAVDAFRAAIGLNPRYLEARLNLAYILERQGRAAEAVAEYRLILSQAPHYPRAGELRARIEHLERGTHP